MLLSLPIGSTSKILQFPIFDSSSTTGAMLTGLVYNSAGLTAYYNREGAAGAATSITLATATKGTWATGGFVAVDGTNMPGWYELHIPDAALASGAKSVSVHLKGATNMVPVPILIELTATSNQDAVRGGMTALPNANAEAAGGLYTRGTGAGQIAQDANGNVRVNLDTIKTQTVTCAAGVTVLASVGTAATSTAQTGDCYARLGAPVAASISADIANIQADTDNIQTRLPAVLVSGTADSGTTTTMVDAARTEADTDYWRGQVIYFTSGNISGQARLITGFNAATDTITFSPATTQAVGTNTYEIWPGTDVILAQLTHTNAVIPTVTTATNVTTVNSLANNVITAASMAADAGAEIATAVWTDTTAGDFTVASSIGKSVMNGVALGTGLTVASVSGSVGSVTGAVGSVTAGVTVTTNNDKTGYSLTAVTGLGNQTSNITGNLSGSVGSVTAGVTVANGGIASTSFAAGAVDAAALATDAGAEIADAILLRKLDRTGTGTDAAQERTVVNALRAVRNKVAVAAGTATIYKEDDLTTAWTSAITTTAGNPISTSDPT